MQRRIEAMIAAVEIVQPPLEKFYGLLNDEQKARVNALANAARQGPPGDKPEDMAAEDCGPSQLSGMELPAAEIDKAVHLTDPERTGLVALQNADTQAAADLLKASCGVEPAITPPGRLAAVRKRLDVMLAAVKTVSTCAQRFLWNAIRRAEGKVRSHRSDSRERAGARSRARPGTQSWPSADRCHHPALCAFLGRGVDQRTRGNVCREATPSRVCVCGVGRSAAGGFDYL